MDGNGYNPYDLEVNANGESGASNLNVTQASISIEQLQHLVQLLDHSDVSEIELHRPDEGTRLVLRKAKAVEPAEMQLRQIVLPTSAALAQSETVPSVETKHDVLAPLVGIFHTWAKPKGGTLVAVGDKVKAGQLVGTIQSLNVINEVETSKAGRVVDILVQEGQAVEYGQHLMTVDIGEGA